MVMEEVGLDEWVVLVVEKVVFVVVPDVVSHGDMNRLGESTRSSVCLFTPGPRVHWGTGLTYPVSQPCTISQLTH